MKHAALNRDAVVRHGVPDLRCWWQATSGTRRWRRSRSIRILNEQLQIGRVDQRRAGTRRADCTGRKNVSLSNVRPRDYPCELIVHLVYEDMQEDGLPGSREEVELLGTNEERIADHFCDTFDARFALCVTSDGVRDQFLYLPEPLSEDEIASELEMLSLSVDYDFGIRTKSDWSIYRNALSDSESTVPSTKRPWWKRLFGAG